MRTNSIFNSRFVETLSKRAYKLSEVEGKIEKVAFDIFKFKNDPKEELWQIQSADDGDYIVAMYPEEEEQVKTASAHPWSVSPAGANLNFFYKGEYVTKMAASQLGFSASDIGLAVKYLPAKLSSNAGLSAKLLKTVDANTIQYLTKKYPEIM